MLYDNFIQTWKDRSGITLTLLSTDELFMIHLNQQNVISSGNDLRSVNLLIFTTLFLDVKKASDSRFWIDGVDSIINLTTDCASWNAATLSSEISLETREITLTTEWMSTNE